MPLQACSQDSYATRGALQLSKCLWQFGQEKLQTKEKQPTELPVAVVFLISNEEMIVKIFLNLPSIFSIEE